jgi:hypothetical protein
MDEKHSEAIELGVKYVLSAENKLVSENPIHSITIGDMVNISQKGIETVLSVKDGSIDSEEMERLKNLEEVDKLSEEHSDTKSVIFGTSHKSCALLLFRNSLTK